MMGTSKTIKEKLNGAVDKADHLAEYANAEVAEKAGEKTEAIASHAQVKATDFVSSMREAVRQGADRLRQDGYPMVGDFIDNASGRTYEAQNRIEQIDTAKISHQVQSFIREKPLIAFGGLALVGFLAASAMQRNAKSDDQ